MEVKMMAKVLSLRDHRKNKGLSKRRLAILSNIPYSSYVRIEEKVENAKIERLRAVCLVLDISLDEIFFGE
jgi:transcriptional regulator with XRE-family HTH domain